MALFELLDKGQVEYYIAHYMDITFYGTDHGEHLLCVCRIIFVRVTCVLVLRWRQSLNVCVLIHIVCVSVLFFHFYIVLCRDRPKFILMCTFLYLIYVEYNSSKESGVVLLTLFYSQVTSVRVQSCQYD